MQHIGHVHGPHTYHMVIHAHSLSGEMEKALTLFREMMRNNYSPSQRICNTIIKGFCLNGRLNDAINMLDFMIENDMDPNAILYNILLKELCKEDRMEDARKLHAAATKRGVFPNNRHSFTECK